jgi:hypothetical protein
MIGKDIRNAHQGRGAIITATDAPWLEQPQGRGGRTDPVGASDARLTFGSAVHDSADSDQPGAAMGTVTHSSAASGLCILEPLRHKH